MTVHLDQIRTLGASIATQSMLALSFDAGGRNLIASGGGVVRVLDPVTNAVRFSTSGSLAWPTAEGMLVYHSSQSAPDGRSTLVERTLPTGHAKAAPVAVPDISHAFSSEGTTFVLTNSGGVGRWEGTALETLWDPGLPPRPIPTASLSHDGQHVAFARIKGLRGITIDVRRVTDGHRLFERSASTAAKVLFGERGLWCVDRDVAILLDGVTGEELERIELPHPVARVCSCGSDRWLCAAGPGNLTVWGSAHPTPRTFATGAAKVADIAGHPVTTTVVVADRERGLVAIDLESGGVQTPSKQDGHHDAVSSLLMLTDGRTVSAGEDRQILIWSAEGTLQTALSVEHTVTALGTTGHQILAGCDNGDIVRVELNGTITKLGSHAGRVTRVVALGEEFVSAAMDRTIYVWNTAHPTKGQKTQIDYEGLTTIALDERHSYALFGREGGFDLYSTATWSQIHTVQTTGLWGLCAVADPSRDRWFVADDTPVISCLDASTLGVRWSTDCDLSTPTEMVLCDTILIVADNHGRLVFLDTDTGAIAHRHTVGANAVTAMCARGPRLVVGLSNGAILEFQVGQGS